MSSNHGNTPAAWSAVTLGLVGFVVGAIGLMLTPANMTIFWIGVIVALAALVVFGVLAKLGFHN